RRAGSGLPFDKRFGKAPTSTVAAGMDTLVVRRGRARNRGRRQTSLLALRPRTASRGCEATAPSRIVPDANSAARVRLHSPGTRGPFPGGLASDRSPQKCRNLADAGSGCRRQILPAPWHVGTSSRVEWFRSQLIRRGRWKPNPIARVRRSLPSRPVQTPPASVQPGESERHERRLTFWSRLLPFPASLRLFPLPGTLPK